MVHYTCFWLFYDSDKGSKLESFLREWFYLNVGW